MKVYYCPNCGTNIHWVMCQKCKTKICDYCGAPIQYGNPKKEAEK